MKKYLSRVLFLGLILFVGILLPQKANATHNRAGEITYRQTGPLTVEATATTFTKSSSINADRDTVLICWGDGNCDEVVRTNGPLGQNGVPQGEDIGNNVKKNTYTFIHTYGSIGHFAISLIDPNRNEEICNINFPNPQGIPFYIQTTVTLFGLQSNIRNNSPILTVAPIDVACIGQPFLHNPGAIDLDGDSLSYVLATPLQSQGLEVPKYESPASPGNSITMDPLTGDLVWAVPHVPCFGAEYNIAFYVIEHRNGLPIDTLMRDMQVRVLDCMNLAPVIETKNEYCVIAGETLQFDVKVTAPASDTGQQVKIVANGGPLEFVGSPATFDTDSMYHPQPLFNTFTWNTNCNHIAEQYYQVVFRATDDFAIQSGSDSFFLTTLKVVRIKVVGPPPEDVMAEAEVQKVDISWQQPYDCEITDNEYFRGFSVWKRLGSNPFTVDTCEVGLAGRGYTKITTGPIKDLVGGRYVYTDTEVERGRTYCYRILAEFARLTTNGFPFNRVESLPSEEICVQLPRDIPLMTKVSVRETDDSNGQIQVEWTKPLAEDLDTIFNPGPYVYELFRAPGLNPDDSEYTLIPSAVFSSSTFSGANDTTFLDTGINTIDQPYSYKVAFYVKPEKEFIGFSTAASSVFLNISSTDNRNDLSWEANVPWDNYSFKVFRENTAGNWIEIGTSTEPSYMDFNLINLQEYCYYVEAEGTYGIASVATPLINDSQERCGTPIDNIPPCPPELTVSNLCDQLLTDQACQADDLENTLSWNNPNLICDETDDVIAFKIYYAPFEGEEFIFIEDINSFGNFSTTHQPDFGIAGCYAVTAIDSFANESVFSNIVCVDNCPTYSLPNVFTPNGDGANELFIPFPYCFIESVEFQVFNQWGQKVFETTDPDLNWDGTNLNGDALNEGTYYYTCRIFEQRVAGIMEGPEILSGYIEIILGQ